MLQNEDWVVRRQISYVAKRGLGGNIRFGNCWFDNDVNDSSDDEIIR
jgi:hypothetical protein